MAMAAETTGRPEEGVRSVVLAFRVIRFLADADGERGVTAIAQGLGANKASVYRHLRTLVSLGYVDQDPRTEKYRVGVGLYLLGRAAGEQIDILREARRVMERLRDDHGHAVTLGRPVDDGILIVEMLRGLSPIEIATRPGYIFPYHATAQGKLALAFGPPQWMERVLAAPLTKPTARTVTDPDRLKSDVETVRLQGWAVAPEEILPGLNALAAPVLGANGFLVATLSIVGSVKYIGPVPEDDMLRDIVAGAREVSHGLGYRDAAE